MNLDLRCIFDDLEGFVVPRIHAPSVVSCACFVCHFVFKALGYSVKVVDNSVVECG